MSAQSDSKARLRDAEGLVHAAFHRPFGASKQPVRNQAVQAISRLSGRATYLL